MIKKISGFIGLILASLSTIITIIKIPNIILSFTKQYTEMESAYDHGYLFGNFLGFLFLITIIALLWTFGLRWTKKPKT